MCHSETLQVLKTDCFHKCATGFCFLKKGHLCQEDIPKSVQFICSILCKSIPDGVPIPSLYLIT